MAYFEAEFIEQVQVSSDLVALISEDTHLKGSGDRYMGKCPFPSHKENTPSFSVSSSKGVYHCFGCKASGNIFTYLKEQRGMDFVSAVEFLARKSGIPIPEKKTGKTGRKSEDLKELFLFASKVEAFYRKGLESLNKDHKVFQYLGKRGWSEETIKSFHLGFVGAGNRLLKSLDPKKRLLAKKLGLISISKQGLEYDTFRDRLIFPIFSHKHQVVGFGARVLDDSLPKYINSKESPLFHKGELFYGLNEAAKFIREKNQVLIVEGYTDLLSLFDKGVRNTLATLGTALTKSHAKLLKRYTKNVVLIFDGDEAGMQASRRSLPILLEEGLRVSFFRLPEKEDPDSFIRKKGDHEFLKQVSQSQDLFFFLLQKRFDEIKSKGGDRFEILDVMAPLLALVKNEDLFLLYKQRLLDLFGSDLKLAEKALNKRLQKKKVSSLLPPPALKKEELKIPLKGALSSELLILTLCLEREDLLGEFLEKGLDLLKTREIREVFTKIEKNYRQKGLKFHTLLHLVMNDIEDSHLIFKSSYPILNAGSEENEKKVFKDCLSFLENRKKEQEAGLELAEMKMGHKDKMKSLKKIFTLTKQRLTKNQSVEK